MICPECGGKTIVLDTRHNDDDQVTYRYRKCIDCEHKFYTAEVEINNDDSFKIRWNRINRFNKKRGLDY